MRCHLDQTCRFAIAVALTMGALGCSEVYSQGVDHPATDSNEKSSNASNDALTSAGGKENALDTDILMAIYLRRKKPSDNGYRRFTYTFARGELRFEEHSGRRRDVFALKIGESHVRPTNTTKEVDFERSDGRGKIVVEYEDVWLDSYRGYRPEYYEYEYTLRFSIGQCRKMLRFIDDFAVAAHGADELKRRSDDLQVTLSREADNFYLVRHDKVAREFYGYLNRESRLITVTYSACNIDLMRLRALLLKMLRGLGETYESSPSAMKALAKIQDQQKRNAAWVQKELEVDEARIQARRKKELREVLEEARRAVDGPREAEQYRADFERFEREHRLAP